MKGNISMNCSENKCINFLGIFAVLEFAIVIIASVDKGTHGFSRGKTTSGVVILVGGRQPACLVCLASRRLSSVKNSEGLAGWSGALSARQRTQTYWRMSRTITRQTAAQSGPQACVPLSTDAILAKAPQFFHVQIPDEQQEETVLFQSSGSTIEFLFQFVLRLNFGPYWNSGNTFSCRTEIRNLNICSSRILYDFSNSFLVCLAHQHPLQQFHRAGSGRF